MKRDGRFYLMCALVVLAIMAGAALLTMTLFTLHRGAIVGSGPVIVEEAQAVFDTRQAIFYN